jgi:nitrogen fixation/metabolism regulation signal transduction histidine kinase
MKKQLLYAVVLCSSFSFYAATEEKISPEMFSLGNLAAAAEQAQMQAMFSQFIYMIRQLQDAACSMQTTLEQVKEAIKEQVTAFNKIPNDNTPEAYMMRQAFALYKEALKVIADATRNKGLPAVEAETLRKGVDTEATRLKVIEYIESLLK